MQGRDQRDQKGSETCKFKGVWPPKKDLNLSYERHRGKGSHPLESSELPKIREYNRIESDLLGRKVGVVNYGFS